MGASRMSQSKGNLREHYRGRVQRKATVNMNMFRILCEESRLV